MRWCFDVAEYFSGEWKNNKDLYHKIEKSVSIKEKNNEKMWNLFDKLVKNRYYYFYNKDVYLPFPEADVNFYLGEMSDSSIPHSWHWVGSYPPSSKYRFIECDFLSCSISFVMDRYDHLYGTFVLMKCLTCSDTQKCVDTALSFVKWKLSHWHWMC